MGPKNLFEKIIYGIIILSLVITLGVLLWIVLFVVSKGIGHVNLEFLLTSPKGDEGGIFPMIVNTIYIIGISIAIAAPIGILSAIYLTEYARQNIGVKIIRFATESLAGIPSIIYGLFGMIFFVFTLKWGWSLLVGGITLSIMVLPTIIRTTEESLKNVPLAYREASLGLGASKLRTTMVVVLPSALPGIVTAVILSVGRVVGETAAVYLTAGTVARVAGSIFESGRTLSVHMYLLAKEGISFESAYATATVLFIVVFIINLLTKLLSRKLSR